MIYKFCTNCGKLKSHNLSPNCGSCAQTKRSHDYKGPRVIPAEFKIIALDLIKNHTLQEIADMYGVSRERIRQKILTFGIPSIKTFRKTAPCATPGCPKRVRVSLRIGFDKCQSCRLWDRANLNKPIEKRRRRYFEPPRMCLRHPDRRAKANNLCASCRIGMYLQSPQGKAYLKRYKENHKEQLREIHRKYSRKVYAALTPEQKRVLFRERYHKYKASYDKASRKYQASHRTQLNERQKARYQIKKTLKELQAYYLGIT